MAQVGDSAYTQHGLGQITEIINERGRRSFRVSGRGFHVWVDETRLHVASGLETTIDQGGGSVNKDNHTTLPYNPKPQYSVDLFRRDQNIQPGENEIDPDERLHPADSVSFDSRTDPGSPQPSSSLFASPGGGGHFDTERTSGRHSAPGDHDVPMGEEEYESYANQDPSYSGGRHETYNYPGGTQGYHPGEPITVPNRSSDLGDLEGQGYGLPGPERYRNRHQEAAYRPAGLSDRYAHFEIEADDHDSPVAQFRRDPVGYIRTCGHLWTDGDDSLEKFADYTQLIDIDPRMRQAAWTDVRRKAMRLRHEGNVQVNDHGAGRIYATVKGDNGTYDVMIVKGGSYGGMGGGQSVTDWACSCPWGRWAFKRQMSYVGRLCSHGYATYLTMQSKDITPDHFKKKGGVDDYKGWLEDNDQSPEPASIASYANTSGEETTDEDVDKLYDYAEDNPDEVPERDFKAPYTEDPEKAYKQADVLRTKPQSLTPSLREVPDDGEEVWSDVEKDERETTGPDDIVHFSSRNTMRRLHAQPTGDGTGGLALPTGSTAGASAGDMGSPDAPPVQPPPTAPMTPTASYSDRLAAVLHTAEGNNPFDSERYKKNWQEDARAVGRGLGRGMGILNPTMFGQGQGTKSTPTPERQKTNTVPTPTVPIAKEPGQSYKDVYPQKAAPAAPTATNGPAPQGPPSPETGTVGAPPAPQGQGSAWTANPGLDTEGKNAINTPEYKVTRGDTLNTILERGYGKDNVESKKQEVMKANNITNPDLIQADSTMKLPGADTYDSMTSKPKAPVAPGQTGTPTTEPGATEPGSQAKPFENPKGQTVTPTVPTPAEVAQGRKEDSPGPITTPTPPAPPAQPQVQGTGLPPSHASLRYADTSDSSLLDKLRDLSRSENHEDCLGDMDDHNDELRDVVDELRDRGYDASFMVAAHEDAADDLALMSQMMPGGDVNQGFAGSGSSPRDWITDSESYVDEHERPHYADEDWHEDDGSDIIKFNDGRSKPQQGPGKSSQYDRLTASLHYAADEQSDQEGMFNPDNPGDQDWDQADPMQLVHQIGQQVQKLPEEVLGMAVGKGMGKMLAKRTGRGPINPPRIDPGVRQPGRTHVAAAPPEDFGYDGGADDSAYLDSPDGGDIVAAFQRSGAAAAVMGSGSSGSSDGDIAAHAQAFLRTAGRKYTPDEQRELEAEFHPQGARNLPTEDDLAGTHYLLGL